MKPLPTTDARWLRTRRRLLAGGREVFAAQGVEGASIQDIVRAAGVSQPSFYNHFASKDELASAIAAEFFQADRKAKQAVFDSTPDPAEAIAINVYQTLSIATRDPVIAWTFLKSEMLRRLVITNRQDPLIAMIRSGIESGRFAPANPHTLALAIRGGAFAVIQDMLNGGVDESACGDFQELTLRMLGLSPGDSAAVVRQADSRRSDA